MKESARTLAFAICKGFWSINGLSADGPCECQKTGRKVCPNMKNAATSVLQIIPTLQLRKSRARKNTSRGEPQHAR